jgi:hypothetical protein
MDDGNADFPAFEVSLAPTGNEGSGFHTQNDPRSPYQRENVVERKGAVDVRCSILDVVHGLLTPEGEDFCTLIVLQFRFDPRRRARRISSVDIELRFSPSSANGADPVVGGIAPNGRFVVSQTTQTEETTLGGDAHLGGGAAGAEAGATLKREKVVTREATYATTVTGSIDLRGRNYGQPNCVSWTLLENPESKTGVPAAMKAAVLLKRRDEENFECAVSVKAKADWRTSIESLVGSTAPDDPVLFDPTLDPTTSTYNSVQLKLGELDLNSISDVTFSNVVDGAVKTMKFGSGLPKPEK